MAKHGIEQHFVRPDRVYATGVLSPIVGYQPVNEAQQIAARFVSGGQGLAGPQIQLFGRTRRRLSGFGRPIVELLGGARLDGFIAWIKSLFAGVRVRIESAKLRAKLRFLPAGSSVETKADGTTVTSVDTSPRSPQPSPGAIPVTSGWAPPPQSPTTAANIVSSGFSTNPGAPMLPAIAASAQLVPAAISAPAMFWQQGISPDFPPTVAFRAGTDALKKFYSNLAGNFRRRR